MTQRNMLDWQVFLLLPMLQREVNVASHRLLELNMAAALAEAQYQIVQFRSRSPDIVFEKSDLRGGIELKWLDTNVGIREIQRLIQGINCLRIQALVVVSKTPLAYDAYKLLKEFGQEGEIETDVTFLEKERLRVG